MPKNGDPHRVSPKRERWRFAQAVQAVSPDRVRAALARDPDMLGDWFLLVVDEVRAFVESASRMHGRVVMRFSDPVLEVACVEHLQAVGPVFHSDAEADEYCRRVRSEASTSAIAPDAEPLSWPTDLRKNEDPGTG